MPPWTQAEAMQRQAAAPAARTGGYLGVTLGWQYSAQLTGPLTYPDQYNISLYNPDPKNPDDTWDNWADQLAQAGVDFVSPNCTGSYPKTNNPPSQMAPLLASFQRRGLEDRIKFAIWDDNAASWCAQWNLANGRGFGYAEAFDVSDPDNWKYLYDYNYKIFYQTIPDANRFKIDGRPVIMIWTSSPTFVANAQGNLSQALTYVRQQAQADFGINPYIIGNEDFLENDTTCAAPGILDATQRWFGPPYDSFTLSQDSSTRVGVAVAEFQHTGQNGFLDPDHGQLLNMDLSDTVQSGAMLTLCEGFTDYEEDAALFRVRNTDPTGNPLTYDQTLYDYPNERLNILRAHSYAPFPASLLYEAEGCDEDGGANGGNGLVDYYRNGNIAIEKTSDVGGGWDVGWMQPDGTAQPPQTLPNTGGLETWTTFDLGSLGAFSSSYHAVRFVFDDGNANFNWWQTSGGTTVSQPALPTNLALGKPTVVSSTVAAPNPGGSNLPSPGSNAVDGNASTEWHSAFTDDEWIYVDLGSPTAIAGVTLRWQVDYAAAYKVPISDDAMNWTDEFSTTNGQGHVEQIPFNATTRYVRMQGVTRSQYYGYGIFEFEVNAP